MNQVGFVQYNFKGEEHKFKLLGRGNAKSKHVVLYQLQRTKESATPQKNLSKIPTES